MTFKSIIKSMLVGSLLLCTPAMAADYIIDKQGQHAFITWKASHLGYSYNVGRFNDFEGVFSFDHEAPEKSKATVVIQAQSIDSNHAERDKHLRGDDFFDVEQFPTITFNSTKYIKSDKGDTLKGVLTLRGIEKELVMDVRHIGEGKDPWGGYRSGFEAQTIIKAADFGLPAWVGDVEVEVIVEGILSTEKK